MEKYFDKIFEKVFDAHEADLWYKARHFVMEEFSPIDKDNKKKIDGISYDCKDHLHIVVDSIEEEMIAVVRQICLLAHYPNFKEEDGSNRTVITFCLDRVDKGIEKYIKGLGNLMNHIRCRVSSTEGYYLVNYNSYQNDYLPLDIEFEFLKCKITDVKSEKNDILKKIYYKTVKESFDINIPSKDGIDISKGMLVNMVYNTGASIENLPACDNENVARYSTALNVFCYNLKHEEIEKAWKNNAKIQDDGSYRELDIKNQLSSIFCADCFESRLKGILDTQKKTVYEHLLFDFETVMEKLRDQNIINLLVKCEHTRWNVERLIMGYKPLEKEELFEIECCFGQERKGKIKAYKNSCRHIDLCSNKNLRRINPADVKYDYFLMLAMPQIVLSSII